MCGIVGLLVKTEPLRESLGELMVPMFVGMGDRGPDSAGLAVFTEPLPPGFRKYSLYCGGLKIDWTELQQSMHEQLGKMPQFIETQSQFAILIADLATDLLKPWLQREYPQILLLSSGQTMSLYKDAGTPAQVADRYAFKTLKGTHLVGHTRMATESAVTPAHAHPFTAGEDFCLVHNGSLSNPYSIRRKLEPFGIEFETDNDTEAACRFLQWRMQEGDDLKTALQNGFDELDGFYTFLMGTATQLALVRDAFACKPAIVAETKEYVAIASEFRALAHLPNIHQAHLYEPAPEEIYLWQV